LRVWANKNSSRNSRTRQGILPTQKIITQNPHETATGAQEAIDRCAGLLKQTIFENQIKNIKYLLSFAQSVEGAFSKIEINHH